MPRTSVSFRHTPQPWLRGPATIEVDRGQVVVDEDRLEQYWPWTGDAQLAFELANITQVDAIPAFVARYGLLRNGPGGGLSEPISDWLETASGIRGLLTAAINLERARHIDREDWVGAITFLQEVAGTILEEERVEHERAREVVARWVSGSVTERIGAVQVCLTPLNEYIEEQGEAGEFALAALPEDLVGFAYWQVASMLSSQTEIQRCEGCDRMFSPRRPDQKFHDTACANRTRQRRHAARARARTQ